MKHPALTIEPHPGLNNGYVIRYEKQLGELRRSITILLCASDISDHVRLAHKFEQFKEALIKFDHKQS